jgi:multiple sugar transport system permease protein
MLHALQSTATRIRRRRAPRDQSPQDRRSFLVTVLCAAIAVAFTVPILWMVSTSFKQPNEVFSGQWLPEHFRLANYPSAWAQYDFTRFTINSAIVSVSVTAAHVLLASLAGFGLAKYRFLGRDWLLVAILCTIMLPVEVIMVPLFTTVQSLGWLNSYQGMIVPVIADAFGVFLMRQFMLKVPDDLIEAARLDGAGELRIFFQVAVPLSWPAIATLAIFVWRESWDEFLWPFLIISDNVHRTLPLGIALMQQSYVTDYGRIMALATVATIPPAVVFLLFQRAFMRGFAISGLKG